MFPSDGSRVNTVERYDAGSGEWNAEAAMPRHRAGCVGWVSGGRKGEEEEFWVMGGYGDYRTLGGVFRADVHCRDVVVMGLRSGKWREIGEMWQEGERRKLGPVVVVDGENGAGSAVFMLDHNDIFRWVLLIPFLFFIYDQNYFMSSSSKFLAPAHLSVWLPSE